MKKARKFLSVLFAMIFMLSMITMTASAEDDEYINNTAEINFENIDVYIADHTELILEPSDDIGLFEKIKTEKQIEEFSNHIENYPTTKSTLTEQLKTGDLLTVSYSETPFVDVGDHLEPLSSSAPSAIGELNPKHYFSIQTAITRGTSTNSAGEYLYTVITSGEWSINTILSGAKYPSYGEDYIILADPSDMTYVSSTILALYDDGEYGNSNHVSGGHYTSDNGRPYVQYDIQDDPLGTKQLQSFTLIVQYRGQSKNITRNIDALYVHTWMNITINSIEISTTIQPDGSISYAFALEISNENKYWDLPSNVAFNF